MRIPDSFSHMASQLRHLLIGSRHLFFFEFFKVTEIKVFFVPRQLAFFIFDFFLFYLTASGGKPRFGFFGLLLRLLGTAAARNLFYLR